MFEKSPEIVVSESDLSDAITFLKELPYSATKDMPHSWSRRRLLNSITEAIKNHKGKVKVDTVLQVTHGVWAIIKPFGIDLAGGFSSGGRLQVWLLIRKTGTNPKSVYAVSETE